MEKVREVLGDDVLHVSGRAVHSTRTSPGKATRGGTPSFSAGAIKVAADYLALILSDVLLTVGSSSFSGGAAAAHLGIAHTTSRQLRWGLTEEELAALAASFEPATQ